MCAEIEVTTFFSFTTYLTGLAFLIMAWTNVEYKYRLRMYMSWFPRTGMFVAVAVVGILVLVCDFITAQGLFVQCPYVQHIIQLLLAASFFFLVLNWVVIGFILPPKFNKRNCRKLENELVVALECGRDDIMQGVLDFISRSLDGIVKHAPVENEPQAKQNEMRYSAQNILALMGTDYFCNVVVKYNPGVAIELFREMVRQRKFRIGVDYFAKNFVTQALINENSFIYRETELYNGVLSFDKPFMSNLYSNAQLVQEVPGLLEPHYKLTSKWNDRQINAYGSALLLSIEALLEHGCINPYIIHEPLNLMYYSARNIERVNGLSECLFENQDCKVFRSVARFYKDLVHLVASKDKICGLNKKYSSNVKDKDILDVIADSLIDVMFATSLLMTPQETSRSVREIDLCMELFDFDRQSMYCDMLIAKVCRALYNLFQKPSGLMSIYVLIFCLDCFGLERREQYSRFSNALHRFSLFYARHHFLEMYGKVASNKDMKFPDGITIDLKKKVLRKTSVKNYRGERYKETLILLG